jgi:rhodanese-related sulfurtransferase
MIVSCSEGFTSSLAAAALQDLGLWRATDIAGGFRAWLAADLSVTLASKTSAPDLSLLIKQDIPSR